MSDPRLICPLPCAYSFRSSLPWPPQLPGTSNWATGDAPTILAYLQALGERLWEAEGKLSGATRVPRGTSLLAELSKKVEVDLDRVVARDITGALESLQVVLAEEKTGTHVVEQEDDGEH